jgi:hypothetical protein
MRRPFPVRAKSSPAINVRESGPGNAVSADQFCGSLDVECKSAGQDLARVFTAARLSGTGRDDAPECRPVR